LDHTDTHTHTHTQAHAIRVSFHEQDYEIVDCWTG